MITTANATRMLSSSVARRAVACGRPQQVRTIAVGTDMLSTAVALQKARPWHNSAAEGSNLAVDNAVTLKDLFANKTVAIFGVPAPFTGTCTNEHYPGYQALAAAFCAAGVDEIVCYAVADPYAHAGWSRAMGNDDSQITFLADPAGTFAEAYGVAHAYDAVSLGARSIRFSMLVHDGNVVNFHKVEDAAGDAATLLEDLKELKESLAA
jgi:peroxiredoxin